MSFVLTDQSLEAVRGPVLSVKVVAWGFILSVLIYWTM